jgi:hypothetical protein
LNASIHIYPDFDGYDMVSSIHPGQS